MPRLLEKPAVSPIARWSRVQSAAPIYGFRGFAVLLHGERLHEAGLVWGKAVRLSDLHPGSQIAIWTHPT